MKCNDYIKLTKGYLRNYVYYKQAVKNLELDISDIEQELNSTGVKISKYSADIGGGAGVLNETESNAANRIDLNNELNIKKKELLRIKLHINKLEAALDTLPNQEHDVIKFHFIDRLTYMQISDELYFSERWVRNKINAGVKAIAIMLFGGVADENVAFIQSA